MKIKFIKKELLDGLNLIQKFVAKQSHLTTLQGVCFKSNQMGLKLIATNLELGAEIIISGQIDDYIEISGVVDVKVLTESLKYFSGENIILTLTDQKITATSSEQELDLALMVSDDFPSLPENQGQKFEVNLNNLKNSLEKILFCVNRNNARPELSGIYCDLYNNQIILAASDSFRLAQAITTFSGDQKSTQLLPWRLCQEILGLNLEEEMVKIYLTEHQIVLEWSYGRIISRLLEGSFPAYKNIIPTKFNLNITLIKADFLQAVQGALAIATGPIQETKLKINPQAGTVNLESHYQQSSHKATVACQGEGEELLIALNVRYLSEGVAHIPEEVLTLKASGSVQPLMIFGGENKENFYLLMPLQN